MFSAAFKALSSGIAANYSVSKNPQFVAGPWSVFSGKKKGTNDAVSVFVFDKKAFQAFITKSGISRTAANDVYDRLKREVNAMAKIRHPSFLRIVEPLEDGRSSMTFIAEPLNSCLKTLIDHSTSGSNLESELDELVIQTGLLQVTEALLFLHNTAGQVHLDIQPSSIFIDAKGDWKLGGLGFLQNFRESSQDYFLPQYDPRLPHFIQLNLDYSAPELVLDRRLDPSNDVFSLGCLISTIYTGQPPLRTNNNSSTYKSEFGTIQRIFRNKNLPAYIQSTLPRILSRSGIERMSLEELKRSEFFDNPLIRTINFIDDFPGKLSTEKKTFLSGLKQMLPQFPKSVLQQKILQTLVDELGKDESLTYLVLENIILIGKDMSQLSFAEKILPHLDKVRDQFGCQTAVLDHFAVLLSRLNPNEFKDHILPIILKTLETAPPETQAIALRKTGDLMEKLDFVILKTEVFPQISSLFSKTVNLSVKLEALKAFRMLIGNPSENGGLDKYTVTEKLLPLLGAMKTREPIIIMTALDVYVAITNIVDTEVQAKSLVPHLLLLSLEAQLTKTQFHAFMNQVKSIVATIEATHIKQLSDTAPDPVPQRSVSGQNASASTDDFNSLIYGTNNNSNSTSSPSLSTPSLMADTFGGLSLQPAPMQAAPLQAQRVPLGPMRLQPLKPTETALSSMPVPRPQNGVASLSPTANSSIDWTRATQQKPAVNWSSASRSGTLGVTGAGTGSNLNSGLSFSKPTSTSVIPTLPKPMSPPGWGLPQTNNPQQQQQQKPGEQQRSLDQYQSLL